MHLHSIEVALQGGPVPPRFISIKWGGTSAPPEFTGGYIDIRIYIYIIYIYIHTNTRYMEGDPCFWAFPGASSHMTWPSMSVAAAGVAVLCAQRRRKIPVS